MLFFEVLVGCALFAGVVYWLRAGKMPRRQQGGESMSGTQVAEATELLANQIAATIHDGPTQTLALSIIRLETLLEDWPADQPAPAALREPLVKVIDVLKDTAGALHRVAYDTKLPALTGLPLQLVLERVVSDFTQRTGLVVTTHWDTQSPGLVASEQVNGVVFRCIQEALNNAAKHADGQKLAVALHTSGRAVSIQVTDEGPGFTADAARSDQRLGLRLMQTRVDGLGGQLGFFKNTPHGAGVEITFEVPD